MAERWSDKEVAYLRKHYPNGDTDKIAWRLGRSAKAIREKAGWLCLRKTEEFFRRQQGGVRH